MQGNQKSKMYRKLKNVNKIVLFYTVNVIVYIENPKELAVAATKKTYWSW